MALVEQTYVIQLGSDFAATDTGRQYFAKDEAESIFNQLHQSLKHVLENGNEQEYEDAYIIVCNFRILPYWLH